MISTIRYLIALCVIFFLASPGRTAPHLRPGAYPKAAKDMIHRPSKRQLQAHAGSLRAATIANASGVKKVAVIIVQFPAGTSSLISGSRTIQSVTNIKGYFDQMKAYFREASYFPATGSLDLDITYFNSDQIAVDGDAAPSVAGAGVYIMDHPMEYYGCGDEGAGCSGVTTPASGAAGNYLTRDAIIKARTSGHTALKSVETGGTYHAVIVVHAGNGNETTEHTNGDIWSIFYSQDEKIIGGQQIGDLQPVAQTAGFTEGDVVPETETSGITSPLGVMCHEFGHSLGLPDLYNTASLGGTSVDGKWEIMDSGPYLSAGANPSHPGVWDKVTLGWISPTVATARSNVSLGYVETTASGLKIPVLNGFAHEYFLVEYRSRSSAATFDHSIPGDGLLIWHVDDDVAAAHGINASNEADQNTVNIDAAHYGVVIISADGSSIAQTGGTSGNLFTNDRNFTHPQSVNFRGQPTGVNILSISGVGTATASMDVENFQTSASQAINKLISYPNPAGKGYSHPSGEGHATVQFQLTKPPNDLTINIYTLSGDLVRKIGQSDILRPRTRTVDADYKFVYEFDWDLKNGDGAMVAPGVYLIMGRADGESKTTKTVIIR